MRSACSMFGVQFQGGVGTSQGKLASYVPIAAARTALPCNGAPALLERAFDMRISMQAQCETRLRVALATHAYRQTKGIRK